MYWKIILLIVESNIWLEIILIKYNLVNNYKVWILFIKLRFLNFILKY